MQVGNEDQLLLGRDVGRMICGSLEQYALTEDMDGHVTGV
jgi:hypothetical protein